MMAENEAVVEKSEDELFAEALRDELQEKDILVPEPEKSDDETNATVEPVKEEEPSTDENARVEVIPGYTADELSVALGGIGKLQKALDTTNGTYGQKLAQLSTTVDQLLKKLEQQPKLVMPKIKLDKLKEADYNELADLLQSSFDESFKELNEVPQQKVDIDMSEYDNKLQTRISEFEMAQRKREQERELKQLKRAHPDYAEVAGYKVNELGMVVWNNLEFGMWAANSLNQEEQQGLLTSDDAEFLSEVLAKFKESKKAPEDVAVPVIKDKKVAILENAVKPKGIPVSARSSKSEDDEFREALMKELRS